MELYRGKGWSKVISNEDIKIFIDDLEAAEITMTDSF
jgi:hypothetical protein